MPNPLDQRLLTSVLRVLGLLAAAAGLAGGAWLLATAPALVARMHALPGLGEGGAPEAVALLAGGGLAVVACAVVALLILARWPGTPGARPLGLSFAFGSLAWVDLVLAPTLAPMGLETPHGRLFAGGPWAAAADAAGYLSMWMAGAAFVRFAAVFPRPLTREALVASVGMDAAARRRVAATGPAGQWSVLAVLERLARTVERGFARVIPYGRLPVAFQRDFAPRGSVELAGRLAVFSERPALPWLIALAVGLPLALLGAGTGVRVVADYVLLMAVAMWTQFALVAAYHTSAPEDRRRMLWVVEGSLLGGVLPILVWVLLAFLPGHDFTAGLVVPAELAEKGSRFRILMAGWMMPAGLVFTAGVVMAVFYDGALDPRLALRKTTLYGLVGIALVFLFGIVETVASDLVLAPMGMDTGVGSWIAGGAAAFAFGPLQEALKGKVDRAFGSRFAADGQGPDVPGDPSNLPGASTPAPAAAISVSPAPPAS